MLNEWLLETFNLIACFICSSINIHQTKFLKKNFVGPITCICIILIEYNYEIQLNSSCVVRKSNKYASTPVSISLSSLQLIFAQSMILVINNNAKLALIKYEQFNAKTVLARSGLAYRRTRLVCYT